MSTSMSMLKQLLTATALAAASALVAAPALACDGEKGQVASIGTVNVEQLAAKLDLTAKTKAVTKVAVFDANSEKTRTEKGIIPTAILLPSSSDYDLALLPKDKASDVVFYCAAERCSSAKTAAQRALEAGYSKVSVMPEGIAGWVKAGKATQKVAPAQG